MGNVHNVPPAYRAHAGHGHGGDNVLVEKVK